MLHPDLEFLVPFASLMLFIGCYILASLTLLKINALPSIRSFKTSLQGYKGRFKWAANLLIFIIGMILEWEATAVPATLFFISLIILLKEIFAEAYVGSAAFAVFLIVAMVIAAIAFISNDTRWFVVGIITVNVFVWPAALGLITANRLVEHSRIFHITTIPSCKMEIDQFAALIVRSIERGLIVVEDDKPGRERIITWSCIASVQAGENT